MTVQKYRTFPDGSKCVQAGKRLARIWFRKWKELNETQWPAISSMFASEVQQRYRRRYGRRIAELRERGVLYDA